MKPLGIVDGPLVHIGAILCIPQEEVEAQFPIHQPKPFVHNSFPTFEAFENIPDGICIRVLQMHLFICPKNDVRVRTLHDERESSPNNLWAAEMVIVDHTLN